MDKSLFLPYSIITFFFRLHDLSADFLARYLVHIKKIMLVVAHLALLGFFLPDLRRDFGEWAATLLIGILFLSPLSRIFRMRLLVLLMSLRRELGISMAYLATVHGVGYLLDPDWYGLMVGPYFPGDILGIGTAYLMGMAAYLLTLPLLLTSNNLANRLLGGKNWKRLHRLVYGLFIFAIIHRLLVRGADAMSVFQAVLLLSSYVFLKLLSWKNFLPPLSRLIDKVARYYHEYRNQSGNTVSRIA